MKINQEVQYDIITKLYYNKIKHNKALYNKIKYDKIAERLQDKSNKKQRWHGAVGISS